METGMEMKAIEGTYEEFRDSLKQELEKQVEGFVRIGYRLKLARDTEILKDSGYKDYKEFAWEEYRLSESVVSRYIGINDRYSVDGYSETLRSEYQGYGYTKLAEMLMIPDEIAESLDPSLSKMEIRQIAGEIKEEGRITDLEVLMEGQQEDQKEMKLVQKVMHQYFYDHREVFVELAPVLGQPCHDEKDPERIMESIAPAGMAVIFVRVQGTGKIMLTFKGPDQEISLQNTRTMETEKWNWVPFCGEIRKTFGGRNLEEPKKAWEEIYQEPYGEVKEQGKTPKGEKIREKKQKSKVIMPPEKRKIAPAQEEKDSEPEGEKVKEPEQGNEEVKEPEKRAEESGEEKEQIPGQDSILNHPEYLPENYQTEALVDGETVPAAVIRTDTQRKEECLSLISAIQGNVTLEKYQEAYHAAGQLLKTLEVLKC